jgi:hypothetical protein
MLRKIPKAKYFHQEVLIFYLDLEEQVPEEALMELLASFFHEF